MAARYTVATKFTGDSSDLKRATGEGSSAATKLADDTEASGKRSNIALAGIAVGAAAMAKSWVDAATESQQVGRQTEAVIKSTGGAAKVSAKDVDELSASLSRKTGIDDEAVASGENVLLTFTKVRNEAGKGNDVFTQATKLALDMSVALGSDLAGANILLGKALNDPIKGISALSRAGVSFTAEQKDQIRTLVESGKTLDAQKIILRELSSEFEGSAEAQATAMGKAKVAIGNVSEELGGVLLPVVDKVADGVSGAIGAFESLPEPMQDVVGQGVAVVAGLLAIGGTVSFAADHLRNMKGNLSDLLPALRSTEGGLTTFGKATAALGIVAAVAAVTELGMAAGQLKLDVDELAVATTDLSEAGRENMDDLVDLADQMFKVDDITRKLAGSNIEAAERFVDAAEKAGVESTSISDLRQIIADKRDEDVQAAIDSKHHSEAMAEAVEASDQATDSYEEQTKTLEGLQQALLATFDSNLAYRNAVDQTEDAVAGLTEMVHEGKRGTEEYDDALRGVEVELLSQADAAKKAAEDQAKANGATDTAAVGTAAYKAELLRLRDRFPELSALIQGYIDKLNEIPTSVGTTLTVETREARNSIARSKDAEHRAGGGPVKAGHLYLVGEEGPEPFIPDQDGTILPHSTIARGGTPLAATGSTPEVHLHFHANGTVVGLSGGDVIRWMAEGVQRARDEGYPI